MFAVLTDVLPKIFGLLQILPAKINYVKEKKKISIYLSYQRQNTSLEKCLDPNIFTIQSVRFCQNLCKRISERSWDYIIIRVTFHTS